MPDILINPEVATDRLGDPIPGAPLTGAVVQDVLAFPRKSSESDQNTVIIGVTLWFEPGQGPIPKSQETVLVGIKVAADGNPVPGTGKKYQVEGEAGVYEYEVDDPAGTEVQLVRVEG